MQVHFDKLALKRNLHILKWIMETISIVKLIKIVKINRIMDVHLKMFIYIWYISIYIVYICKGKCLQLSEF